MNPLIYLGFTIFSVIMQFCVMEFVHERFQLEKDPSRFNESAQEDMGVIKKITNKPHALFYRTDINRMSFETNNNAKSTKYSNSSIDDMMPLTSTDMVDTSTILDVFYDENTWVTGDDFTTESYFPNSDIDNVTDITLMDNISTTIKSSTSKRVAKSKKCHCNLMYKMCDINCCCDPDCSEEERRLFIYCEEDACHTPKKGIYFCNSYLTCGTTDSTDLFNDLFCVMKVNLPDKRIKSHYEIDIAAINATFKWKSYVKPDLVHNHFKKKKYEYGDPLWLRRNGSTVSMYIPVTTVNSYCSGEKQIQFLVNENIKCNVKLDDVHVYSAVKAVENTEIVSVTDLSLNKTDLDCSTLHCVNWSVVACEDTCNDFNVSKNSPECSENYCNNLASAVEYTFYYFESKVINATLKLYLTKVPTHISIITQEITVKWYLGNESIEGIIQLSGNPGYIRGLPIIVSFANNNHTSTFFNGTYGNNFLPLPHNVNGKCQWSLSKNNSLLFELNMRKKCRLYIKENIQHKNATDACRILQRNIKDYLGISKTLLISPYGNPSDVSDDKWVRLETYDENFFYGQYHKRNTKLICNNLITRFAFVIAYADVSGEGNKQENKIVKAFVDSTRYNVTFDMAEFSTILTIDIRFIDISRPNSEFAGAPQLNIHLPKDFFFDYPSNKCYILFGNRLLASFSCLVLLVSK